MPRSLAFYKRDIILGSGLDPFGGRTVMLGNGFFGDLWKKIVRGAKSLFSKGKQFLSKQIDKRQDQLLDKLDTGFGKALNVAGDVFEKRLGPKQTGLIGAVKRKALSGARRLLQPRLRGFLSDTAKKALASARKRIGIGYSGGGRKRPAEIALGSNLADVAPKRRRLEMGNSFSTVDQLMQRIPKLQFKSIPPELLSQRLTPMQTGSGIVRQF